MHIRNGFLGLVAALATLAVVPTAAHAGALSLYSSIQGAGSVSQSSGPDYSCDAGDQTLNTDVRDCGRKFYEAVFAVSITLKATPSSGWRRTGWDGCPKVLDTGECQISGPVASTGSANVRAIFEDNQGPALTIDAINVNPDDSVTGWFHADEPVTFECWNKGTYIPCSSGWTTLPYPPYDYGYEVRATDVNGQETIKRTAFRIFDTAIGSGPDGLVATRSATFTFGGPNNPGGYQCSIDGGSWFTCTSPYSYNTGSDGQHTFRVRGLRDGLSDPYPAKRTWTVDTVAPDTTISGGPSTSGEVATTSASLTFGSPSGADASSYECRLDGGAWAPCVSPRNYDGLAQGGHTFEVRAKDAAGNADPTPATRSWTIDSVPSATTLDAGPAAGATLASTSAEFAFSAPDNATFQCKLDDSGWSECASPLVLSGLAQGSHTFQVRSIDDASNVETAWPARTWTVDTVVPVTRFTAGPAEGATLPTGQATFAFAADEAGATFECRLDKGAWAPCTSPKALSGLAPGAHAFEVRARDAVGNTAAAAGRAFVVASPRPGGDGEQPGAGPAPGAAAAPQITAPRKLRVRADRRGRIRLAGVRVTCPAGGACKVAASAKGVVARALTLRAASSSAVRATLSRATLTRLRAKGRVVLRLRLTAAGPGGRATRPLTVTVMRR